MLRGVRLEPQILFSDSFLSFFTPILLERSPDMVSQAPLKSTLAPHFPHTPPPPSTSVLKNGKLRLTENFFFMTYFPTEVLER